MTGSMQPSRRVPVFPHLAVDLAALVLFQAASFPDGAVYVLVLYVFTFSVPMGAHMPALEAPHV